MTRFPGVVDLRVSIFIFLTFSVSVYATRCASAERHGRDRMCRPTWLVPWPLSCTMPSSPRLTASPLLPDTFRLTHCALRLVIVLL
ncbi:hypothetical protein LXA43DRAFT_516377 [Ganoderma leucocontextum]|nr:hypothetical protein LXA43DRAFT_516377 [Ganoderma leucocontextum]